MKVTFQSEQSCEAASAAGASDELKQKYQRIQQLMKERSLDALLISRHENIAWASAGLVDVRVGLARETGAAGSLLFTRDSPSFT
jgi:Xaa-Pro aminopeptidase